MAESVNGRKRPSLSEQIDRLDQILDGLSEGLGEAVAGALKEALGPAVREAVAAAVADALAAHGPSAEAARPASEAGAAPTNSNRVAARTAHWARRRLAALAAGVVGALAVIGWRLARTAGLLSAVAAAALPTRGSALVALAAGGLAGWAAHSTGPAASAAACGLAVGALVAAGRGLAVALTAANPGAARS